MISASKSVSFLLLSFTHPGRKYLRICRDLICTRLIIKKYPSLSRSPSNANLYILVLQYQNTSNYFWLFNQTINVIWLFQFRSAKRSMNFSYLTRLPHDLIDKNLNKLCFVEIVTSFDWSAHFSDIKMVAYSDENSDYLINHKLAGENQYMFWFWHTFSVMWDFVFINNVELHV